MNRITEEVTRRYLTAVFGVVLSVSLFYGQHFLKIISPPHLVTIQKIASFSNGNERKLLSDPTTKQATIQLIGSAYKEKRDGNCVVVFPYAYVLLVVVIMCTSIRTAISQALFTVHRPTLWLSTLNKKFRFWAATCFGIVLINYLFLCNQALLIFKKGHPWSLLICAPLLLGPLVFVIQGRFYRRNIDTAIMRLRKMHWTNDAAKQHGDLIRSKLSEFLELLEAYRSLNIAQLTTYSTALVIIIIWVIATPPTNRVDSYLFLMLILSLLSVIFTIWEWFACRKWYFDIIDWEDPGETKG